VEYSLSVGALEDLRSARENKIREMKEQDNKRIIKIVTRVLEGNTIYPKIILEEESLSGVPKTNFSRANLLE